MGSSEGGLVIIPSSSTISPKPENGDEIGVFGAEKYFKMKLDNYVEGRGTRLADDEMRGKRRHGGRAASSVSSESSWNSQTALVTRGKNCPHSGKKGFFLSGLSCVRYCNKAKSVGVIDKETSADHGNHKFQTTTHVSSSSSRRGEGYMSPKVMSIQSGRDKNKRLMSDEVQVDIAVRLQKRLSVLSWDAIPNAPPPRGSRQIILEEEDMIDEMNDGSSSSDDLFEIQNLAAAPSECSSIQWSVITASVADHDHDDEVRFAAAEKGGSKKKKKLPGGGILGCKSLKALEVAEPQPPPPAAAAYTTNYGRPAKY